MIEVKSKRRILPKPEVWFVYRVELWVLCKFDNTGSSTGIIIFPLLCDHHSN